MTSFLDSHVVEGPLQHNYSGHPESVNSCQSSTAKGEKPLKSANFTKVVGCQDITEVVVDTGYSNNYPISSSSLVSISATQAVGSLWPPLVEILFEVPSLQLTVQHRAKGRQGS